MKLVFKLTFLFTIFSSLCFAQRANVWMIGPNYGLDFNENPPRYFGDGGDYLYEGRASICDENGNLLYYYLRDYIYNGDRDTVTNSEDIINNFSRNKSTIFVHDNYNDSTYLFVSGEDGMLYQTSIFDDVVVYKNREVYSRPVIDGITVIENGNDYWLLTHTNDSLSSEFLVFAINQNGINKNPITYDVGIPTSCGPWMGYNNICGDVQSIVSNLKGNRFAYINLDFVQIFDFDKTTGDISNPFLTIKKDTIWHTTHDHFYGAEFSPNDKFLYLTKGGNTRKLFQVNLNTPKDTLLDTELDEVSDLSNTSSARIGDLETGPDGKIYLKHLYWNRQRTEDSSTIISIIHQPNKPYTDCEFQEETEYIYIYDPSKFIGTGYDFPSFVKGYLLGVAFISTDQTCNKDSAKFNFHNIYGKIKKWKVNGEWLNDSSSSIQLDVKYGGNFNIGVEYMDLNNVIKYYDEDFSFDPIIYTFQESIQCDGERRIFTNNKDTENLHWFEPSVNSDQLVNIGSEYIMEGLLPDSLEIWNLDTSFTSFGEISDNKYGISNNLKSFEVLKKVLIKKIETKLESDRTDSLTIQIYDDTFNVIKSFKVLPNGKKVILYKTFSLEPGEYNIKLRENVSIIRGEDSNDVLLNSNFFNLTEYGRINNYVFDVAPIKECGITNYNYVLESQCDEHQILGYVYLDENSNGLMDENESGMPNYNVISNKPFAMHSTDSSGYFEFTKDRFGTFTTEINLKDYYQHTIPSNGIIDKEVNSDSIPLDTLYFGLNVPENIKDLSLQTFTNVARPGMLTNVYMDVENIGNVDVDDYDLRLNFNPMLTPSNLNGFSVVNDSTLSKTVNTTLQASQKNTFIVGFTLPETAYILGDTLLYEAYLITNGDLDNSNDSNTVNRVITGAYDPNIKFADQGDGEIPLGTSYLNYSIYFQNTGSDTAFTVVLKDDLDLDKYQIEGIDVLSSSHYQYFTLDSAGALEFTFPNILLPDSLTNPEGSIGYVKFKIELKEGLTVGDEIENQARIYFDFNEPIFTNTAHNELYDIPTYIEGINHNTLVNIFPNPASDILNITSNYSIIDVKMYNLNGKLIKNHSVNNTETQFSIEDLNTGIYIVKTTFKNQQEEYHKVIIQK